MFRLLIIINAFDPAFKRGTKPRLKAVVLTPTPPPNHVSWGVNEDFFTGKCFDFSESRNNVLLQN